MLVQSQPSIPSVRGITVVGPSRRSTAKRPDSSAALAGPGSTIATLTAPSGSSSGACSTRPCSIEMPSALSRSRSPSLARGLRQPRDSSSSEHELGPGRGRRRSGARGGRRAGGWRDGGHALVCNRPLTAQTSRVSSRNRLLRCPRSRRDCSPSSRLALLVPAAQAAAAATPPAIEGSWTVRATVVSGHRRRPARWPARSGGRTYEARDCSAPVPGPAGRAAARRRAPDGRRSRARGAPTPAAPATRLRCAWGRVRARVNDRFQITRRVPARRAPPRREPGRQGDR